MLSTKQRKCLELMFSGDMTQAEIAASLKVSKQTISNWKKNAEFNKEFANGNRALINALVPKAIKKEAALLDAESEQVQLAAAKDILDRAGYTTPKEEIDTAQLDKLDNILDEIKADAARSANNNAVHD